jgi:CRP-like cAMP-binding protein
MYVCVSCALSVPTHSGGRQNYFGEIALLRDQPRGATIKTEEYCQFLTISKADFTECMEKLKADLAFKLKAVNMFHVRLSLSTLVPHT